MKANEIGLPTFEAEVSCGAYCQGGSVNMKPTTYAEFTDADEVWVRGDDAARLAAEIESMKDTILALSVARAERDALAARLVEAERIMKRCVDAYIAGTVMSSAKDGYLDAIGDMQTFLKTATPETVSSVEQ